MKLTFVDCTTSIELQNWVMMRNQLANCPIYRFYTLFMYGIPLDNLNPLPYALKALYDHTQEEGVSSYNFDIAYANQILNYEPSWIDFMQIIGAFQYAPETIVLCDYTRDEALPVIDSLIKFIQQRYGINSYIAKDIIDIDQYAISDFSSQEGYRAMMADIDSFKQRFFTKEQLENEVIYE